MLPAIAEIVLVAQPDSEFSGENLIEFGGAFIKDLSFGILLQLGLCVHAAMDGELMKMVSSHPKTTCRTSCNWARVIKSATSMRRQMRGELSRSATRIR